MSERKSNLCTQTRINAISFSSTGMADSIKTSKYHTILENTRVKAVNFSKRHGKALGIIALQVMAMTVFGVSRSFAIEEFVAPRSPFSGKKGGILNKVFLGANSRGSFKNWKAGDTRSDISGILNAVTMICILGVWMAGAYFFQAREEKIAWDRMKKEVGRETEYRENMYFEAVEKILSKLEDPKLKGSVKATLTRNLKELDPTGDIQKFLSGDGPRPDLDAFIKDSQTKKKTRDETKAAKKAKQAKKKKTDKKHTERAEMPPAEEKKSKPDVTDEVKPAEKPAKAAPANEEGASYKEVLMELNSSLKGALSGAKRKELVLFLQDRIESVSNLEKRETVVSKIASKLGENQYWIDYHEKVFG